MTVEPESARKCVCARSGVCRTTRKPQCSQYHAATATGSATLNAICSRIIAAYRRAPSAGLVTIDVFEIDKVLRAIRDGNLRAKNRTGRSDIHDLDVFQRR